MVVVVDIPVTISGSGVNNNVSIPPKSLLYTVGLIIQFCPADPALKCKKNCHNPPGICVVPGMLLGVWYTAITEVAPVNTVNGTTCSTALVTIDENSL